MKKKTFELLGKKVIPALPGFTCKGWLIYEQPVGSILKGFCGDDSSFDPEIFVVNVFILPLYVPTDFLYFNYGERLWDEQGCDVWWNVKDPPLEKELLKNIQQNGVSFLNQVNSPAEMALLADSSPDNRDLNCLEAAAYSWVLANEMTKAHDVFGRLFSNVEPDVDWQLRIRDRAQLILQKLDNCRDEAVQQLADWERQTRKNLGLE